MARRLPRTLADYVVVGLNPALIMILIASVIFFLIDLLFPCGCACTDFWCNFRLKFVFAMYIMGIVAVGRLSMEEGVGYASSFGAPLAIAAFIAINAFVQVNGMFAAFSPIINIGLMAFVWWLAYQLTYDCTVLEDRPDTSDQGLLSAFGGDDSLPDETPLPTPSPTDKPLAHAILDDPMKWLKQMWERSKQPHAHGVWILYFAIGALPIFGFGGWFIKSRQMAFAMLVIFVATTLALLLSTSFLGLRRYLRRRNLEMPVEMTSVWLAVGGIMIVGVLLACMILPRPGAEVAISQIPFPTFSSPWQTPSPYGMGNDGKQPGPNPGGSQGSWLDRLTKRNLDKEDQANQESQKQGSQADPNSPNQNQTGVRGEQQKSSGNQGKSEQGKSTAGEKNSNENSSDQGKSGDKQSQQQEPSKQPADQQSQQQQAQQQKQNNAADKKSGNQPGTQSVLKNKPQTNPQSATNKNSPTKPQPQPSPQPQSSFSATSIISMLFSMLGTLLKLLFYAVLIGVIAYYVYKYREELKAAWQQLLAELKALWERWFGAKPKTVANAAPAVTVPVARPFADFANPFTNGWAPRMTPLELMQYTFTALLAWGREHDCPRQENETPHEYVERLELLAPHLTSEAKLLVDYYGLAAYAAGRLPPQCVEAARALWNKLSESPVLV